MEIQVNKADKLSAAAMVDSLELAITILTDIVNNDVLTAMIDYVPREMQGCITDLQCLRVAYMLIARNASSETKKEPIITCGCRIDWNCPAHR